MRWGPVTYDVTAYNLTVEGIHTYYAGDTPVLVHNAKCPGARTDIDTRPTPGGDGSTSRHLIERDADGNAISTTHQVTRPDGNLAHQHQKHHGKYGENREFPDEWVQWPDIG